MVRDEAPSLSGRLINSDSKSRGFKDLYRQEEASGRCTHTMILLPEHVLSILDIYGRIETITSALHTYHPTSN